MNLVSNARQATDAVGGTITAHSDGPGKGAIFTLDLPVKAAPDPR